MVRHEKIVEIDVERHGIEYIPADFDLRGGYKARDGVAAAKRNAKS